MIQIGIVGSDNSHADRFSELVNLPEREQHIEGAHVECIYGREPVRTAEVAKNNRIPNSCTRAFIMT